MKVDKNIERTTTMKNITKISIASIVCATFLAACGTGQAAISNAAATPQTDFHSYINADWLKETKLGEGQSQIDNLGQLTEKTQEAIQEMYKGNYEGLHRRIKMNRDNFIYAAIITGSLDLIRDLPEGDEIDMCEERKEGEKREKKTVLSLLKVKLGNVSNQLEQAIQNSSIEKLNTLTLSIFAITNEDDVLKIIN